MIFKNQSVVSRIESMSLEEEEDDEEHPSDMTSASLGSMEVGSKPWQEHSKLIIVSRNEDTLAGIETIYDYEVLMVQRAAESTNPDAVDFPGGTIKWQDCSERWIALYERLGVPSAKLGANAETTNSSDLIYSMNSNNEALVRQTSLRIAAIRETFEDVGILLVKTRNQFETAVSNPLYATAVTTGFDRKHWQRKVRADPWAFIELCEMLEVAPDIFSVYNWANWLMPPISIVGETRVDEAFFMACLQGRPATKLDPRRVAKAEVRHQSLFDLLSRLDNNVTFNSKVDDSRAGLGGAVQRRRYVAASSAAIRTDAPQIFAAVWDACSVLEVAHHGRIHDELSGHVRGRRQADLRVSGRRSVPGQTGLL